MVDVAAATRVNPAPVFTFDLRVYYEDTDAGGVVYYANYLRFMERARTEWLRALGFGQDELARASGVLFAVRRAEIEFLKPARLDDALRVTVQVTRTGNASINFAQRVLRADNVLCSGEIKIACLAVDGFTPTAVPPALREKINGSDA